MTSESRIWFFFIVTTLCITGLLVLLRADGLGSKLVFAVAMVALTPHVLLFRSAWRLPEGSRVRTLFYRWAAACFLGLVVAHFIADRAIFR